MAARGPLPDDWLPAFMAANTDEREASKQAEWQS
jgi:hypothetical protein